MFFDARSNPRTFTPFLTLRSLQRELERLVLEPGQGRSTPMAFAVYTREGSVLLRTPLPGVEAQDIRLEIEDNVLTLSGRFAEEPEVKGLTAQHLERARGSFSRALHLSFEVDAARVEARLRNGVLEIQLPRLDKPAPVKIPILSEARRN